MRRKITTALLLALALATPGVADAASEGALLVVTAGAPASEHAPSDIRPSTTSEASHRDVCMRVP